MECDECSRLIAEHERLKLSLAVAKWRVHQGITRQLPVAEYRALLKAATEASLEADLARTEMEQHQRIHDKTN